MSQTALLDTPVDQRPFVESLQERISAEFREMPGMSLTRGQARRLFNVQEPACSRILDRLVQRGVLRRGADGQYRLAVIGV